MKHSINKEVITKLADQFKGNDCNAKSTKQWSSFLSSGSHLWMDTGDIGLINQLWTNEFSALTTNNTLLNNEVQKGEYDQTITTIASQIKQLNTDDQVKEIGFCINAIHGLRLARLFNCKVSVELHTDLANNIEDTFLIGRRLHAICPEQFIIKVPFTPAGLIGARKLHDAGIPVNLTLCFSVRQNVIASLVAKPAYSNVFVGRVGAYFSNNGFKVLNIAEKVCVETQKCLRKVNERGFANTKLIAASIRSSEQLIQLVGTDVLTIPAKVVDQTNQEEIFANHSGIFDQSNGTINDAIVKQLNLKHLWQIRNAEKEVALHLSKKVPATTTELIHLFDHYGCHDIFPAFNANELSHLDADGKIPQHNKWNGRVENYEVGIDALLNKAGLFSFMKDQKELDDRIKRLL
jgi:transaldolase